MRLPSFPFPPRLFLLALLASGWLHYRALSSRHDQLAFLQTELQRSAPPPEMQETIASTARLRTRVASLEGSLSKGSNSDDVVGGLMRIMHAHGILGPVLRTEPPTRTHRITQQSVTVEFASSCRVAVALLDELASMSSSWSLSRLQITHGTSYDPSALTVTIQLVTFTYDPEGP